MMQTLLFDRRLVHGALIFFACAAPLRAQGNGLIRDVQLSNSGTLQGLVIPVSGSPAPGSMVQIRFQGKTVAVAKTATDGRFAIGRVRPGVHEVVTASGQTPVRIWANGTAPAGCQSQLTLPAQQNFVSMNQPMSGMCGEGCATQPCQSCAPASGLCLVDAISLATVGSSIAALVIAIDANRTADAASNAAAAAGAGAVAANVGAGNVVNAADANGGVASP